MSIFLVGVNPDVQYREGKMDYDWNGTIEALESTIGTLRCLNRELAGQVDDAQASLLDARSYQKHDAEIERRCEAERKVLDGGDDARWAADAYRGVVAKLLKGESPTMDEISFVSSMLGDVIETLS
jgi:hypothetical protein